MSNDRLLLMEDQDGECHLILGKKGKRAFITWVEAHFLKKRLGEGVEIVHDRSVSNVQTDLTAGIYSLKIPIH